MDWNANLGWILLVAFGLGALHALEPGHGKSIMGAYLVASRGGIRHAVLLGLVVTVTHTLIVFLLAVAALTLAERFATAQVTHGLEIVSGTLVLGVGLYMLLTSLGLRRRPRSKAMHDHLEHEHHHGHSHEHHSHHGHAHDVEVPAGQDPLGIWTLTAVGASGGLVPCPAALTALLAAVNLGRPAEGIAVVAAMSLGIATTLIAIGIAFVQAAKVASRAFDTKAISVYASRVSAVLISALGLVLLGRALLGHSH